MRPRFVLLGDSITQQSFSPNGGWGASLAHHYARKADVVLRGYSGYNTRWALFLLPKIFPQDSQEPPLLVTIFFGANDAAVLNGGSSRQHVPLQEYKNNLLKIISHIKASGNATRVVLITPPPVHVEGIRETYGLHPDDPPTRNYEVTGTYAKACIEAANESGVPVLDLWSSMQLNVGWRTIYLSDGLHLSMDGNKFLFEMLLEVLEAEGLSSEAMEWDFKEYSLIDANEPANSFC
eukprot:c15339_g1_i1 orf=582-1289(-)